MNREEVIRGLQCCRGDMSGARVCPDDCPYHDVDEDLGFCDAQLMRDAEILLAEDARMEDDLK